VRNERSKLAGVVGDHVPQIKQHVVDAFFDVGVEPEDVEGDAAYVSAVFAFD